MNYQTVTGLSCVLLCAPSMVAANEAFIGANVQYEPSIYKDGKNRVSISPFRLNRDGFYLPGPSLNVYRSANSRAYVGVGLDEWDYKRGKSSVTSGMDDLKRAVNVRAGSAWKTRVGVLGVDVSHDVRAHKGNQARIRYVKPIQAGRALWLPYASVQWLDGDVGNYYFGVKASEATATRPAYNLGTTQVWKAGVDVEFPVSSNLAMVTGVGVTAYGKDIKDSPLVEKSSTPYAKVGLAYRFR